jgi:hypothetical protein
MCLEGDTSLRRDACPKTLDEAQLCASIYYSRNILL